MVSRRHYSNLPHLVVLMAILAFYLEAISPAISTGYESVATVWGEATSNKTFGGRIIETSERSQETLCNPLIAGFALAGLFVVAEFLFWIILRATSFAIRASRLVAHMVFNWTVKHLVPIFGSIRL